MEELIKKKIKGVDVLDTNLYFRMALLKKTVEDMDIYIIVRIIHPIKHELNIEGVTITAKQLKSFIPVIVKACDDYEYMKDLYDLLSSVPLDSDMDIPL